MNLDAILQIYSGNSDSTIQIRHKPILIALNDRKSPPSMRVVDLTETVGGQIVLLVEAI